MNRFLSVLFRPVRALLRLPMKLLAAPRRMWGLALPTRVAVMVAVIVVVIAVVLWWKISHDPNRSVNFSDWPFWLMLTVLTIAIPLAVRWAIQAWLEGPTSRYPDIDRAWNAGLKAVREQNVDPADVPIFVVHGFKDERQATALIEASQERFPVNGVPGGVAELQWYASSDAILLVCMGQSQITALANAGVALPREVGPVKNMRDTLRGTIQAMEQEQQREPAHRAGPPAAPISKVGGGALLTKTMMPGEESVGGAAPTPAGVSSTVRQVNAHELTAKLDYVCQLLRRLRQPACPVNGILTVLPLELAIDRSVDQSQVQQAMRGDLETLRRGLQLRCPAVTLVTGMETEIGSRELVRRVGTDLAKNSRFGKGVNVWTAPSPEQVEAVTANACVSFDVWAYKLFREENGLTKPGNPKLYSLICRIRTELRERLQNILVGAYGHGNGPQDALANDPLLFGGCYFASTGDRPDLQAFVRGVLHLLIQSQDKLEWTSEAKKEDAFYQRLAHVGFALDGILLLLLVGYLLYVFLER